MIDHLATFCRNLTYTFCTYNYLEVGLLDAVVGDRTGCRVAVGVEGTALRRTELFFVLPGRWRPTCNYTL